MIENYRPFRSAIAEEHYVAFVDILGFGKQVKDNYYHILNVYDEIINRIRRDEDWREDTLLRIFSDSLILSSKNIGKVISAVNLIHMLTLFDNCLIRGGIGYGNHIEVSDIGNLYVVSQALVQAVEVEKSIKYPCVALHESIEVPLAWWLPDMPGISNFLRKIIYFEGINLINPFNIAWGTSASGRVRVLATQYPEHNEKYNWFVRLYDAVKKDEPLIPPAIHHILYSY